MMGVIVANSSYPENFLLENLKIQAHVIEMVWGQRVSATFFSGQ
ncbi:hypothetical protein OAE57_01040 [Synechococcus sp. AH-551-C10]|nr:hypothetical protein [Synechococcus sp. AH-551-C10]MDB4659638.1 hypothetical protein [Synechococcus sp. AH-551-C10]